MTAPQMVAAETVPTIPELQHRLSDMFTQAADHYVKISSSESSATDYFLAVGELAVVSMALDELVPMRPDYVVNPFCKAFPKWMSTNRTYLNTYTRERPEYRAIVHDSIFFEEKPRFTTMLDRRVSASIYPSDDYGPIAFADGLLRGKITVNL